jgi:hypothetical protein
MRFLFLTVFLFLAVFARATNYYFSSLSGDDNRSTLEAQNPATPWKSIDKLNAISRDIQPGDSIFFKRGETFYGTITIRARGASGHAIYYGAYGTGANPVLTAFTTVTGWTLSSNGIYAAPLDATNLQIITINGEAKAMGRYPNTGYLTYENHVNNQSITDNDLPVSPNWTGGEVVIRKLRFILDRHVITSHAGHVLNYSTSTINGNNSAYGPVNNNGYFIQNHLGTLDQFGEWYCDPVAKRLYVYFGNTSPADYVVKASTKDNNILVSTNYYLTFENLDLEGANSRGLYLINISNSLVQNCNFYNQGGISLYGIDLNAVKVTGGSINTSFSNGINFELNANNCTIESVSVHNSNTIPGTGRSGNGVSVGINVYGDYATITNNRVIGCGYNGIQFTGNNVLVEHNYVDSFCTVKDDGGGIYTFNGSPTLINANRKIQNNVILNAIGAQDGTGAYYYEPYGKAAGIYLDDYSNAVEITSNTVTNGDWAGFVLHNAYNNLIRNNIIYNHRYQLHVSQYAPATRNNTVTDNQYIAKQKFQTTLFYQTYVSDSPAAMGMFDYNVYARPVDDNSTIQVDNLYSGGNGSTTKTLAQWQSLYSLDVLSQKSPLTFTTSPDDNIRFEYNATPDVKVVSLGGSYLDVKNNTYSGDFTLQPYASVVLLKSSAVSKATQAIAFASIPDKMVGDAPFTIDATASSALPVSLRVLSGPATISGNTVTITGVGTVTIVALQSGNSSYFAASSVTQNFTVVPDPNTPPAKINQQITFSAIANRNWSSPPFALNATASSNLPVSYRIVSGPASVTNNVVNITGAGDITIEASQTGDDNFNAALPVTQTFTVAKLKQTIRFPSIPDKTFTDPPFQLNAVASSDLIVSYRVVTGPAIMSGNLVTLMGAGTVTIEASQAGDDVRNPAIPVTQTFNVAKAAQTITFNALPNKTYGDTPFDLSTTASSNLPVSMRIVSGPASLGDNKLTITGTGVVTLEATQDGNGNYSAATPVQQSFTVNKASQTISFDALSNKTFGDAPFALSATATSALPVNFKIVSGPATLTDNILTITGTIDVIVEASQTGDDNYNAATPVQQTLHIGKAAQIISFDLLADKTFGDAAVSLAATSSSSLPVSFNVLSGPATLNGNILTLTGTGTVMIEASQAGDENYRTADPVSRSFLINAASQVITFDPLANKVYGDEPFALSASASSGLPVSYRVVSGPISITGTTVTITGTGEAVIEALQKGNENFINALPVQRSFLIDKADQFINLSTPSKKFGDPPFILHATASSGLPVSYKLISGPATLVDSTLTILGRGDISIEASQDGNDYYKTASAVTKTFTVDKAGQTISFSTISTKTFGDAAFDLTATASSGLPVSFRIVSGPATLAGNTVTINGAGDVLIEASQAGNKNYNAADAVTQALSVAKADQNLSFARLAAKTFGDASFDLNATASSGLPVSFKILSGPATLSGNQLTINGAGEVIVEASQEGNTDYNAATTISQRFTVSKASQAISFNGLSSKTFGDAPFALSANSSSGLPVSYRVVSGEATVVGSIVTITGAGEIIVEVTQDGNENYAAALPVQQQFIVNKANQTISFGSLPDKSFTDLSFSLAASSSSRLPVTFHVVSGPATFDGHAVILTGVGAVVIEASQDGDSQYLAATSVRQTFNVNKSSQSIDFSPLSNKVYGDSPFALMATTSSGLPVSFKVLAGPASISENMVSINGVGAVTIEASQTGNENFLAAASVTQSFVVTQQTQTITFPSIADKNFGDAPFLLAATVSSGLPVTYRLVSGPIQLSGNTVTITGTGDVQIEASQNGNGNYKAAVPMTKTFTVFKTSQAINFTAIADQIYGEAPIGLFATTSSGLPVSFRIITGAALLNGNQLTLISAGPVTIEASQQGNDNYSAATPVVQSFLVAGAPQTISFSSLPNKTFGDAPFTLVASASSGLPVAFQVVSGPATITNNTVTITGVGVVAIEASQEGNINYRTAPPVMQQFTVGKTNQTISFNPLANKTYGDAPFAFSATASSGLSVGFRIVSGPATVAGNMVTIIGAGTITIEASQNGNNNYTAAVPVQQSFTVAKAAQAITFAALANKVYGDAPFALTASASSILPVSYRIVSGPATVAGTTITLTGAGTVVVEASQNGNNNYNAATAVQQSFAVANNVRLNQTITFGTLAYKTYTSPPFDLTATASSGLPVSYRVVSGPITISGSTVTITGVGTATIEASQTGNTTYNAVTPVQRSFTIGKAGQSITFTLPTSKAVSDPPFALTATATSGLQVLYRVVSGPATVSGSILTLTGTGTVTIEASQPGDANYSAAYPLQRSFTVTASTSTKNNQTISFGALATKTFGGAPFTLIATTSSGLPVSYRVVSGPITITGNIVTITGAGTATIEASQSGDANYNAASPIQQSLLVSKAAQTILFAALPNKVYGDPPFALNATASSTLVVSYRIVSGPATVSGNVVTLTGAGTVTIEALQAGDANYSSAAPVQQSFIVSNPGTTKQVQTITFSTLANKTFGDAPFTLNATASSGLAVSFRIVSGPATVVGNTLTITSVGAVVVEASQAGDATYASATPVQQSFTVAKANQVITFNALVNKTFGDAPFALTATSSSGLPVSYRVVSGPATVSGNTVTISGAGTVTIEASQAGSATYNAATPVQQSFTVNKAAQTISFGALANRTYGDAPFALNATASSGLSVSYTVVSGPASISGNIVTLTGTGTVTIQASQNGDNNYNAATAVQQSFAVQSPSIAKQSQTITFGTLAYKTYTSPPFDLTATASSGLPVSYRVVTGPITISGSTVTITGVGSVTIEASQAGNATYNAATPVQRSFTIGKAGQTITFTLPTSKVFGDPPFALTATASSGLPVQYRVVSGPATVSGNMVTITGAGTVTIEASQLGDANYSAAYPLQRSFTVAVKTSVTTVVRGNDLSVQAGNLFQNEKVQLTLYPNPIYRQGPIHVSISQTTSGFLLVYDGRGNLVKQLGYRNFVKDRSQLIELNICDLSSGSYVLYFLGKEICVSRMFQIMK